MSAPRIRVLPFSQDLRSPEQLERGRAIAQEQADQRLLAEYQRRVKENINRRIAAGKYPRSIP